MLRLLYCIVSERFKDNNYSVNDVFNLIDTALYLKTGLYVIKEGKEHRIEYTELLQVKRELISCIFKEFKIKLQQLTIATIKSMSNSIINLQKES